MTLKRLRYLFSIFFIIVSALIFNHFVAKADTAPTAVLRILATTDLHGQVTSYDYETNLSLPYSGLSKVATLVNSKRGEVGTDNTLLVDNGDFLYDYTTNYFYEKDRTSVQPILKAMKLMNYDYLTLGNHEFDYPWAYLKKQLIDSGLSDRVVVSNVIWHDSGKTVFAPSAIKEMQLISSNGTIIPVRVGIVGSSTNSISTRRGDYVNEIDAANNYTSIVAEANRLKQEENVSIVLVLIHGGIGSEKTSGKSDNIGYALSKVSSIDAIVTGHSHETFPAVDSKYNAYKNVDATLGLMNGKPVITPSSHARALGMIDLNITQNLDGTVSISSAKSAVEIVPSTAKQNSAITGMFKSYADKLKSGSDTTSYPIASGVAYHNYDTVVQDSNLYQLFNNAKIAYGMAYVTEYLPAYKSLPVIASTRNLLDSGELSIRIKDSFTAAKVAQLLSESSTARPSGYLQLYEINGKSLREWLEYNASMYATSGTLLKNTLQSYVIKNKSVSTLLQESYLYNWNAQYIFDGFTYQIDLSVPARYSSKGTLQSSKYKRIKNLSYNGKAITDTQKFILVTDTGIPALSFLPVESESSIKPVKDDVTGKTATLNYIKTLSTFGKISLKADSNWTLTASKNYSFLLGINKKNISSQASFPWKTGLAAETLSYSFYKGTLPKTPQGINIVVTQGRSKGTNQPVPVVISATSAYSIKQMKYLPGTITKTTDSKWKKATTISSNRFTVTKNGTYSILVTDSNSKSAIAYIKIDRYNSKVIASPTADKLTNRNTVFTGKALANSTVYVTIGKDTYATKTKSDGTFKIDIKPPAAFATVKLYAEYNGLKSATVTTVVRKTGPDAVTINSLSIGSTHITGNTSPNSMVYALIWKTIYVGRDQTQVYKNSEFYNQDYIIAETDISIDPVTGAYDILVPAVKSNMKVFVFSMDRFGVTSKSTMYMVQ